MPLPFSYTLKKRRKMRSITVQVKHGGVVHVLAPYFVPKRIVELFLKEKTDWIQEKIELQKQKEKIIHPDFPQTSFAACVGRAKKLIKERVEYYNQFYNFPYNRISIKQHQTRWGSCSKKGNLNFNYRLLFLPRELVDYVVVHEICHLKELNHSKNFWKLVEKQIPEYKERKLQLKQY